jgi:hypothetical protein
VHSDGASRHQGDASSDNNHSHESDDDLADYATNNINNTNHNHTSHYDNKISKFFVSDLGTVVK